MNTPLLKQRTMASLLAGPDGSLWIGTVNRGLLRYRNGSFENVEGDLGLATKSVRAMLVDSNGMMWIGIDGGLVKVDGGPVRNVFQGGWEANVHTVVEYPAGTIWVGANNGLHRFQKGRQKVFTVKDGLPDSVWGLAGSGDSLWIGMHKGMVSMFRDRRFRTYSRRDGLASAGVVALLADRDGAIWVGTDGAGLSRFARAPVR